MVPFLHRVEIRQHVLEAKSLYEKRIGRSVTYPLSVEDFFYVLFELETVYDTEGKLNAFGPGIIGCLFPDGQRSPFGGKDKIIAVNLTPDVRFDPTVFSELHTIAHEGMGHYVLHFLKGFTGETVVHPTYCRTGRPDWMEWQSNFAAGELVQPLDKIIWLLDGKKPGEILDVEVYEKYYREFFGANRKMMETRLKALDYKLLNAKYPWADYASEQEPMAVNSGRDTSWCNSDRQRRTFDDVFGKSVFDLLGTDFTEELMNAGRTKRGWKSKLDRMIRAEVYNRQMGRRSGR